MPSVENWEASLESAQCYTCTDNTFNVHSSIYQCKKCGLYYINEHLDREALLQSYKNGIDDKYLDEERERIFTFNKYLEKMRKFLPAGELLEIGSYFGLFLKAAILAGYKGTGIEPNLKASAHAREKFGLDVRTGEAENISVDGKFDGAVMLDVIEHFFDPILILEKINSWLKKDGYLFLSTPDIGSLSAKLQGKRWYAFRQQHLYYFSKTTIRKMLEKTGFTLVSAIHMPHYFSLKYLAEQKKLPVKGLLRFLGLEKAVISLNLFDHVFICAKKIKEIG